MDEWMEYTCKDCGSKHLKVSVGGLSWDNFESDKDGKIIKVKSDGDGYELLDAECLDCGSGDIVPDEELEDEEE